VTQAATGNTAISAALGTTVPATVTGIGGPIAVNTGRRMR